MLRPCRDLIRSFLIGSETRSADPHSTFSDCKCIFCSFSTKGAEAFQVFHCQNIEKDPTQLLACLSSNCLAKIKDVIVATSHIQRCLRNHAYRAEYTLGFSDCEGQTSSEVKQLRLKESDEICSILTFGSGGALPLMCSSQSPGGIPFGIAVEEPLPWNHPWHL